MQWATSGAILLAVVGASACGQKGPLIAAKPSQAQAQASAAGAAPPPPEPLAAPIPGTAPR